MPRAETGGNKRPSVFIRRGRGRGAPSFPGAEQETRHDADQSRDDGSPAASALPYTALRTMRGPALARPHARASCLSRRGRAVHPRVALRTGHLPSPSPMRDTTAVLPGLKLGGPLILNCHVDMSTVQRASSLRASPRWGRSESWECIHVSTHVHLHFARSVISQIARSDTKNNGSQEVTAKTLHTDNCIP